MDEVGRMAALTLSAAARRKGADMAWCAFKNDFNDTRTSLVLSGSKCFAKIPLHFTFYQNCMTVDHSIIIAKSDVKKCFPRP